MVGYTKCTDISGSENNHPNHSHGTNTWTTLSRGPHVILKDPWHITVTPNEMRRLRRLLSHSPGLYKPVDSSPPISLYYLSNGDGDGDGEGALAPTPRRGERSPSRVRARRARPRPSPRAPPRPRPPLRPRRAPREGDPGRRARVSHELREVTSLSLPLFLIRLG